MTALFRDDDGRVRDLDDLPDYEAELHRLIESHSSRTPRPATTKAYTTDSLDTASTFRAAMAKAVDAELAKYEGAFAAHQQAIAEKLANIQARIEEFAVTPTPDPYEPVVHEWLAKRFAPKPPRIYPYGRGEDVQ